MDVPVSDIGYLSTLAGKDVSIITFSRMVGYSLEAAKILEKEGISVEVINLRYINELSFYLSTHVST